MDFESQQMREKGDFMLEEILDIGMGSIHLIPDWIPTITDVLRDPYLLY